MKSCEVCGEEIRSVNAGRRKYCVVCATHKQPKRERIRGHLKYAAILDDAWESKKDDKVVDSSIQICDNIV
jgi:hypothetical protein